MHTISPDKLSVILSEIIHEAGHHTLKYFGKNILVDSKADDSPVTVADRETESLIRERILQRFPDHGVVGEEFEDENPNAEFVWIVDPIDGTQSFVHGIPLYTVLIAVLHQGEPIVSGIYAPATKEMLISKKGGGAFLNGKRVFARNRPLEKATVLTNGYNYIVQRGIQSAVDKIISSCAVHRTWCDAYGHMMVATGRADIMIDPYLSIWDAAPLSLAIREAGGSYLTLDGTHSIYADSGISVTSTVANSISNYLDL